EHHYAEQSESQEKINQQSTNRPERDKNPREIHLRNQLLVSNQAVARLGNGSGKKCPRRQPTKCKKFVRRSITFHMCQPVEYEGENHHRDERLQNGPQPSQERLSI